MISTNGVNWKRSLVNSNASTDDFDNFWVGSGIAFGNGTFVIANDLLTPTNFLVTSDGIVWNRAGTIAPATATKITYGAGTFVAVGRDGIFQSESAIPGSIAVLGIATNGGLALEFTGEIGRNYKLQFSSNLVLWEDLFAFTNSQSRAHYTDTAATNYLTRFYRAVTR